MAACLFICPECGKKQETILRWETCSVLHEYDFEMGSWEMGDDIQGGDFGSWCCPKCKTDILIPDKMTKNIY